MLTVAALLPIAFFAVNSIQTEYARITSRVETTQAKVDALADELAATTKTIHAAIRSLTDRFLAGEGQEAGLAAPMIATERQVIKADILLSGLEKLSDAKPTAPTILMHSGYDCGPCNAWISREMPRWIQSGWRVEVVKELDTARSWPWYEITDRDGSQFEVIGPLSNDNFQAAKRGK